MRVTITHLVVRRILPVGLSALSKLLLKDYQTLADSRHGRHHHHACCLCTKELHFIFYFCVSQSTLFIGILQLLRKCPCSIGLSMKTQTGSSVKCYPGSSAIGYSSWTLRSTSPSNSICLTMQPAVPRPMFHFFDQLHDD